MPSNLRYRPCAIFCVPTIRLALVLSASEQAVGQVSNEGDLAPYFGWQPMEVMVIDDGFGPVSVADMNGDGLQDVVVANNRKSRLEIYFQRREGSPTEDAQSGEVNELPLLWRFRRETIPISTRVIGLAVHDFNTDSLPDLILGGSPAEIILMAQKRLGEFAIQARRTAAGLQAGRNGFLLANLIADAKPELVALAEKGIRLYPIQSDSIGQPTTIPVGNGIVACFVEDFDGDGLQDLMAVAPSDASPVRMWNQIGSDSDENLTELGPENRFELPTLRELKPVRVAGKPGALFATIEQASKRIVLYEFIKEMVDLQSTNALRLLEKEVDAPLAVYGFPNLGNARPAITVADCDGDGLLDVLATNPDSNTVLLYRQVQGQGLSEPVAYPTLAAPFAIASANVDGDSSAEVFVLSQDEKVVGRSDFADGDLSFPSPLAAPGDLVTLAYVPLQNPTLAVITKDKREHTLRLIGMDGTSRDIALGSLARSPETILSWDADQDGALDILLLTRDEPMILLQQGSDGSFAKRTKDEMGQYGLVAAANGFNTTIMDVTGDGAGELILADRNYIRALRYQPTQTEGTTDAPGWQVVDQFNLADARSRLSAVTVLEQDLVVADSAGHRLVVLASSREGVGESAPGAWTEAGSLRVGGFDPLALYAGAFTGDNGRSILCTGADGFAIVRLGGERAVLREVASYRSDDEDRLEHELSSGDVNGDGFTDLVALDAGEQVLEVFSISRSLRLMPANEFRVFQSRLFQGGDEREFEPHACVVADVTGDGAADLLVMVHDRILIYPQSVRPNN